MVKSPDSVQDGGLLLSSEDLPFNDTLYSIDDVDDDDDDDDCRTVRASNVQPAVANVENLIKKLLQVVRDVQHSDDRDVFVLFLIKSFWSRRNCHGSADRRTLERLFRDLMEMAPRTRWSEDSTTTLWNDLLNAPDGWMPIIRSRLEPVHYNMVFRASTRTKQDPDSDLSVNAGSGSAGVQGSFPMVGAVGSDSVDSDRLFI